MYRIGTLDRISFHTTHFTKHVDDLRAGLLREFLQHDFCIPGREGKGLANGFGANKERGPPTKTEN